MFLEQYGTGVVEQHGRQLKEFAVVPAELLENTDELRSWFDLSHNWIETLKSRATN